MPHRIATAAGALILSLLAAVQAAPQSGGANALRIVVVEGEDAVNVIQQKTAVAPVIEVRDRNDQPVSGAIVRFAISRGRATFSGARALSVTTNAAGRAVATGLTPTGSGALHISAAATFQGQTAAVTIAQTNVMTVASGAAAGTSAGGGAGAGGGGGTSAGAGGGAAGGSGGGLSATTIGIVGGAAAGGAIAAKEVLSEPDFVIYKGSYSGPVNDVFVPSLSFCSRTISHAGTVEVEIHINDDRTVTGEGRVNGTMSLTSFSPPPICAIAAGTQMHSDFGPMTGTTDAMAWKASHPGAPGVTATYDFTGALNGDTVVGTFTFVLSGADAVGRGVFPVTLQKQQ